MAGTITARVELEVTNGSFSHKFKPSSTQSITQTTQGQNSGVLSIGTSAETISFTDITSEGVLLVQNLDGTNFIKLGPDSTGMVDFMKIKPGEYFLLRLVPGITLKAIADTAACKLYYELYDD